MLNPEKHVASVASYVFNICNKCSYVLPYNLLLLRVFNDIMSKSYEQRLVTKEHVAMHTNLILQFKSPLYSSTLVIKLFSSIKLF